MLKPTADSRRVDTLCIWRSRRELSSFSTLKLVALSHSSKQNRESLVWSLQMVRSTERTSLLWLVSVRTSSLTLGGGWTASVVPEAIGLLETTGGSVAYIDLPADRHDLWDKFSPARCPAWSYQGTGKDPNE